MTIDDKLKSLIGGTALSLLLVAGGVQADAAMDEETVTKLQEAIAADPELDEHALSVVAADGTVSITGMLDDEEDRQALQDIIDGMEGVDNVQNEVTMQ